MSGAGQRPRHVSSKPDVIVYGTGWCAATQIVRRFLAGKGIRYQYVDLENAPEAAEQLRWLTGGSASHPTVVVGGEILVEPSLGELERALAGGLPP